MQIPAGPFPVFTDSPLPNPQRYFFFFSFTGSNGLPKQSAPRPHPTHHKRKKTYRLNPPRLFIYCRHVRSFLIFAPPSAFPSLCFPYPTRTSAATRHARRIPKSGRGESVPLSSRIHRNPSQPSQRPLRLHPLHRLPPLPRRNQGAQGADGGMVPAPVNVWVIGNLTKARKRSAAAVGEGEGGRGGTYGPALPTLFALALRVPFLVPDGLVRLHGGPVVCSVRFAGTAGRVWWGRFVGHPERSVGRRCVVVLPVVRGGEVVVVSVPVNGEALSRLFGGYHHPLFFYTRHFPPDQRHRRLVFCPRLDCDNSILYKHQLMIRYRALGDSPRSSGERLLRLPASASRSR